MNSESEMESSTIRYFVVAFLLVNLWAAEKSSVLAKDEYASPCKDTIWTEDCQFIRDNDWCEDDIKYLKGRCDLTCGWCSKGNDCVDQAKYIQCSQLSQKECDERPEFYSTRCKKSCKWCGTLPDGAWKEWTQWSPCSASCDPGFHRRSRHCLSQNCKGESSDVSLCMVIECPTWADWSPWSACSVTCGKGSKTRTRNCNGRLCEGVSDEAKPCEEPACFEWSECSRSCGGGTRMRILSCRAPDPMSCPKRFQDCNTHRCRYKWSCQEYRYGSQKTACCEDSSGKECVRTVSQRVFGGEISKPKQFAWMVRIEIYDEEEDTIKLLCGGTLIHKKFVLTAAHCLEKVTADQLQVLMGAISKDDTSTLTQRKYVLSFTIHPKYSEPENDLAIMRLKSKTAATSFVSTLCLPMGEETPVDSHCFVAGWGKTDFRLQRGSQNLREARVRHLPFGVCHLGHRVTPYGPHLNESTMMCAGKVAGGVDTCKGDSGGPLMCQRCFSCSWYLAGVTSFGPKMCGIPNVPGVYMRVSHYEDWIVQHIKQFDNKGVVCVEN